jgi:hypothetical protein
VEEPTFDIFRGDPAQNPIWLEPVMGLSNARQQMEQIAAEKPGQYFLFSVQSHSVLAKIDTGKKLLQSKRELTMAGAA